MSGLARLMQEIMDIESVSGNERALADLVESRLAGLPHLELHRDGDCVLARTTLGRAERVVIAGHLDTVPVAGNLPSRLLARPEGDVIWGRGASDMKGGVAVMLTLAAELSAPIRDITWIFYDHEEVEAAANGLGRLSRNRPDLVAADFAVLMEPTGAQIEATLAAYRSEEIEVEGLVYREGLNAVAISGGMAGNVIPPSATMQINYRFAPDKSVDEALARLRGWFPGHDLVVADASPAARLRPAAEFVRLAQQFVAAIGEPARPKYGWTDVARFSELGIPAVNYGPGDPSVAHRDDESCPVSDLDKCAAGLRRWLTPEGATP